MKTRRGVSVLVLVAVCLTLGVGNVYGAGKFPEKPITLVVHAAAGGGSDIFARTLAAAFEKEALLPNEWVNFTLSRVLAAYT